MVPGWRDAARVDAFPTPSRFCGPERKRRKGRCPARKYSRARAKYPTHKAGATSCGLAAASLAVGKSLHRLLLLSGSVMLF
jgi:hypothetical protein